MLVILKIQIKNIESIINFLKDKKDVILIGYNSNMYSHYGFECITLTDNSELNQYYINIEYIIQDSFFESCSNVKLEALFNGCTIINDLNRDK